jgi:uncharacterized membrane protein YedE/YeeE
MTTFTPLLSTLGGALIGLSAVMLLVFSSRIAGITGIVRRLMPARSGARPWEVAAFLAGLIAAPIIWRAVSDVPIDQTVSLNLPLLAVAGALVGVGSAWGNGCTSGHGVCGLARLSPRSIAATATFMAVAVATVFVTRHVIGG